MQIAFYIEQTRISFTVKNDITLPVSNKFAGKIPEIMMALACNTTGDGSAVEEYIPRLFKENKLMRLDFIYDGRVYSVTADDFSGLAELPKFGVTILADGSIKNEVSSQDEVLHVYFDRINTQFHVKVLGVAAKADNTQEGQRRNLLTVQQLKDIREKICAELDRMFWSPAVREIKFVTVDPGAIETGKELTHPATYAAFIIGDRKWEVQGIDEAKQLSTYINTAITLAVILCCNDYSAWFKYRNTISEVAMPRVNPALKVERVTHIVTKSGSNTSKKPGTFSWEKFVTTAIYQVEQNMIKADNEHRHVQGGETDRAKETEFF